MYFFFTRLTFRLRIYLVLSAVLLNQMLENFDSFFAHNLLCSEAHSQQPVHEAINFSNKRFLNASSLQFLTQINSIHVGYFAILHHIHDLSCVLCCQLWQGRERMRRARRYRCSRSSFPLRYCALFSIYGVSF
jgi:hypothetical protein